MDLFVVVLLILVVVVPIAVAVAVVVVPELWFRFIACWKGRVVKNAELLDIGIIIQMKFVK